MNKTIKAHVSADRTKAVSLKDILFNEMVPHLTNISGEQLSISTGYKDLDGCMHGFRPGELTIIGARPAMGKGAFVLGLAMNAAKSNKRVLFISKDMSNVQFCSRVLSIEGKIEGRKLMRTGQLSPDEWHHLPEVFENIYELPLYFIGNTDCDRSFSVEKAKELSRKMKADIVFFDGLPDDTEQLKHMATVLDIPVVTTCGLKRSNDPGPNPIPKAKELLAPNSVLLDADVILLLNRKDFYSDFSLIDEDEHVSPAEILIAKSKYGPIGTVDILFHNDFIYYSETNETFPWYL